MREKNGILFSSFNRRPSLSEIISWGRLKKSKSDKKADDY